jgi:integrase
MARRRANREGTITRRKDGRYEARIYVLTADRCRKRITLYAHTQAEVREKLLTVQQDIRQGRRAYGTLPRLDKFLDYWLKEVIQPNKEISTYLEYQWMTENFLKPGLGPYTLDRLSVTVLQTWLSQMYRAGRFTGPSGKSYKVSADRIKKVCKVLSTALGRAVREELVQRNVAKNVDLPKYRPKERAPWSADEARRFLAVSVEHRLYPTFLILIVYGLRRGEALGLRWGDVDFAQNILRIRKQLQRRGGEFIHKSPKTEAGIRDLALLPSIRDVFLDLHARVRSLGGVPSADSLVFTKGGKPRDPDAFRTTFQRLAKRHGLPVITVHDLRHTAATMLKDAGVPDRDIQLMLGHANVTTTQQIYQHGNLESQRVALQKIGAAILPESGHQLMGSELAPGANCRQTVVKSGNTEDRAGSFFASPTSVANWCTRQDSNLRPLAPQLETTSLHERLAAVEQVLSVSRRTWLVGVVVVKIFVKT